MKLLHTQELAGIHSRIQEAKHDLQVAQSMMKDDELDENLYVKENECICRLRKWLNIHEAALKQKSRILLLKLGDNNHKFFYSAIKERFSRNKISVLHNKDHEKLTSEEEIQQ